MTGLPRWLTEAAAWAYDSLYPWARSAIMIAAGLLALWMVHKSAKSWKARGSSAKFGAGFVFVQAIQSFVLVTGVYEFWHRLLHMPQFEAGMLAVFIEAVTWMAAGAVRMHGDDDTASADRAATAKRLFWTSLLGGGTLAVLAAHPAVVGVGRAVIVLVAAQSWSYLLARWLHRDAEESHWIWSWNRILVALNLKTATKTDLKEHDERLQIARLTRALRWRNSHQPWQWVGKRILAHRADLISEHVQTAAMRQYMAGLRLVEQGEKTSETMLKIGGYVDADRMAVVAGQPVRELSGQAPDRPSGQGQRTEPEQVGQGQRTVARGQVRGAKRTEPAVTSLRSDEQIADSLFDRYCEQVEQAGQALPRYRVEQLGRCGARQATRVLSLLADRHAEQAGQAQRTGPGQAADRASGQDARTESDADSEHTQGAVS